MALRVVPTSWTWRQPVLSPSPSCSCSSASPSSHKPYSVASGLKTDIRKTRRLINPLVQHSSPFGFSVSGQSSKSSSYNNPKSSLEQFPNEDFSREVEKLFISQIFETNVNPAQIPTPSLSSKLEFDGPPWVNNRGPSCTTGSIKRRQKGQESLNERDDSTSHSFKKAFSSIVSMVAELQRNTLQLRDIEGIDPNRVVKEMNQSFVWLFQKVFSLTPDLMIDLMILLANFTVSSVIVNTAIAEEEASIAILDRTADSLLDEFYGLNSFDYRNNITEEEARLWNSVVEEAQNMKIESTGDLIDWETIEPFVSPVTVEIEQDNYVDYLRTDMYYQMGLSQDPNNPLLLSNYAQFLYMVAHDHERAEECFKRAAAVGQLDLDADSLSRYADFLWKVKKDLSAAEEIYQQSIEVDPENTYYISKYASFLWSTGGEETCFPLNTS